MIFINLLDSQSEAYVRMISSKLNLWISSKCWRFRMVKGRARVINKVWPFFISIFWFFSIYLFSALCLLSLHKSWLFTFGGPGLSTVPFHSWIIFYTTTGSRPVCCRNLLLVLKMISVTSRLKEGVNAALQFDGWHSSPLIKRKARMKYFHVVNPRVRPPYPRVLAHFRLAVGAVEFPRHVGLDLRLHPADRVDKNRLKAKFEAQIRHSLE